MSTITTINATDLITNSRAVINTNFDNLNTDKIETSTLDTDTTLAADSDAKIATQKDFKAFVDSGGNQNASEIARGIVEEATDAEVTAGTATGSTGAKLFVTPTKLATRLVAAYQPINVFSSGVTTRDMTAASGVQNIAHGLGKTPKFVRISSKVLTAGEELYTSDGSYDGTNNVSLRVVYLTSGSPQNTAATDTTYGIYQCADSTDGSQRQVAIITFDATNIILTWTKVGTPVGTALLMWEAQA